MAWKRFFQHREPVEEIEEIEEIRAPCLNDAEATIKKKIGRSKYSEDEINKAVALAKKNPGKAGAVPKLFNVPRTTVLNRMKKEREGKEETKCGRKPLFDDNYENLLADFARSMDKIVYDEINKAVALAKKNPGKAGAVPKLFNVPRTTVLNRMKKEREGKEETKCGRKPLFDDNYENLLADFARSMDKIVYDIHMDVATSSHPKRVGGE